MPERGFQAVLGAVANAPGTLCDAELLEMGDVPQLLLSQGYQKGRCCEKGTNLNQAVCIYVSMYLCILVHVPLLFNG